MPLGTTGDRRLELYVRSLSGGPTQSCDHAARVRELDRRGVVADAAVIVWGEEVGLSTTAFRTPVGKAILDRVGAFRAWADEQGATMAPFFEPRTVTGDITGETYAAVRLPVACLAEYDGDKLVHVAPHQQGDSACSVTDRLRALGSLEGQSDAVEPAVQ